MKTRLYLSLTSAALIALAVGFPATAAPETAVSMIRGYYGTETSASTIRGYYGMTTAPPVRSYTVPETAQSEPARLGGKTDLIVTFIDVGQGDSTLIQCPNGQNILIDGGKKRDGATVVAYLRSQGVKKLDLMIATHPDADHIAGLPTIINAFPPDLYLDPGKAHSTFLYKDLLNLIKAKNIPYKLGRAGDVYNFGDVKLEVFHPTDKLHDTNESSVVVKVTLGEVSFLLTGDAEGKAEEEMIIRKHDLKSTILKAGHHGSQNSTSYVFLDRVRPEAVIFSCGLNNQFGHPNKETLRGVRFFKAVTYRTDESGNIVAETDGRNYSIWTEREWKAYRKALQSPSAGRANLNTASLEELSRVPFLSGPKAQAIVDYREMVQPFEKTEEITTLPGIGPSIYEKIKGLLTVK